MTVNIPVQERKGMLLVGSLLTRSVRCALVHTSRIEFYFPYQDGGVATVPMMR